MSTLKVTNIKASDGTSALSIADSTGKVTFPSDIVLSSGIDFGTSTSGSGTVTGGVLDDYEEGTFSVAWQNLTGTPNNTTGYYVKIGKNVHITYYTGSGTISGTGNSVHFNLPFVPDYNAAGSMISYSVSSPSSVLFYTSGNCFPYTFNDTGMVFSGTYQTS